jgi:hypothetical protein
MRVYALHGRQLPARKTAASSSSVLPAKGAVDPYVLSISVARTLECSATPRPDAFFFPFMDPIHKSGPVTIGPGKIVPRQ